MRSAIDILKIGKHNISAVPDLYKGNRLKTEILSEEHFLYRWWFPSDSPIVAYLEEYIATHPKDIDMQYVYACLKKRVKEETSDNGDKIQKTYYALYFGKSTNGRNRFGQHTRGPIKKSTLRETLRAVLSLKGETCTEERISAELQKCYYEWMEFLEDDRELIDSFEMMAIAIGYYPLNMEGNTSISEEWKNSIMDKRKELKDYK